MGAFTTAKAVALALAVVASTGWLKGTGSRADEETQKPPPKIYVVGFETCGEKPQVSIPFFYYGYQYSGWVATLWDGGEPKRLSDGKTDTKAEFIYVSDGDGDVYIAGIKREEVMLWKNGEPVALEDPYQLHVNSLFVSGGDVYVTGTEYSRTGCIVYDHRVGALWKNGAKTTFGKNTSAEDVCASGKTVKVVGNKHGSPVVWVNGKATPLLNKGGWSSAKSIRMAAGKTYVAGVDNDKPMLWVDGKRQTLPCGGKRGGADTVTVFGNDVYVTGEIDSKHVLWKNGVLQDLGRPDLPDSKTHAIFVKDGLPYVLRTTGGNGAPTTILVTQGDRVYNLAETTNSVIVKGLFVE